MMRQFAARSICDIVWMLSCNILFSGWQLAHAIKASEMGVVTRNISEETDYLLLAEEIGFKDGVISAANLQLASKDSVTRLMWSAGMYAQANHVFPYLEPGKASYTVTDLQAAFKQFHKVDAAKNPKRAAQRENVSTAFVKVAKKADTLWSATMTGVATGDLERWCYRRAHFDLKHHLDRSGSPHCHQEIIKSYCVALQEMRELALQTPPLPCNNQRNSSDEMLPPIVAPLEAPKRASLVFFITAHHTAENVARLISSLYSQRHSYLVHVDARSNKTQQALENYVASKGPNVLLMERRVKVTRGGRSMYDLLVHGMTVANELEKRWDHFIHLSESCLPIVPLWVLEEYLFAMRGSNHIGVEERGAGAKSWQAAGPERRKLAVECDGNIVKLPFLVPDPIGFIAGPQWSVLSNDAVKQLTKGIFNTISRRACLMVQPDEVVLPTVCSRTRLCSQCEGKNMHYVDMNFVRGGRGPLSARELKEEDVTSLPGTYGAFFARKFSAKVSGAAAEVLRWVQTPKRIVWQPPTPQYSTAGSVISRCLGSGSCGDGDCVVRIGFASASRTLANTMLIERQYIGIGTLENGHPPNTFVELLSAPDLSIPAVHRIFRVRVAACPAEPCTFGPTSSLQGIASVVPIGAGPPSAWVLWSPASFSNTFSKSVTQLRWLSPDGTERCRQQLPHVGSFPVVVARFSCNWTAYIEPGLWTIDILTNAATFRRHFAVIDVANPDCLSVSRFYASASIKGKHSVQSARAEL